MATVAQHLQSLAYSVGQLANQPQQLQTADLPVRRFWHHLSIRLSLQCHHQALSQICLLLVTTVVSLAFAVHFCHSTRLCLNCNFPSGCIITLLVRDWGTSVWETNSPVYLSLEIFTQDTTHM